MIKKCLENSVGDLHDIKSGFKPIWIGKKAKKFIMKISKLK